MLFRYKGFYEKICKCRGRSDYLWDTDTHPDDEEALNYLKHYKELRKQGLRAYADQYGPLTIDSAKVGDHWDWATQPWPWEGGMC